MNAMRSSILAVTAAAALLIAPAALAAPTCQNIHGDTIRCGTPGAMPVGWMLPPEERLARELSRPAEPTLNELLELICVLGVFFSLLALLPEFDGWGAGGRDEEEER